MWFYVNGYMINYVSVKFSRKRSCCINKQCMIMMYDLESHNMESVQ